ncbi:MAG: hypothetical protein K6A70_00760 [Erysipelotrichaceae bacterium]|jgi:hypothetical protein|nr:hypothetical protein [Erysipelotrichaceae bacterium]
MKDKKSVYALFLIAFIIIWNIENYITNKDSYQFSLTFDTIIPIVAVLLVSYFFIFRK